MTLYCCLIWKDTINIMISIFFVLLILRSLLKRSSCESKALHGMIWEGRSLLKLYGNGRMSMFSENGYFLTGTKFLRLIDTCISSPDSSIQYWIVGHVNHYVFTLYGQLDNLSEYRESALHQMHNWQTARSVFFSQCSFSQYRGSIL